MVITLQVENMASRHASTKSRGPRTRIEPNVFVYEGSEDIGDQNAQATTEEIVVWLRTHSSFLA